MNSRKLKRSEGLSLGEGGERELSPAQPLHCILGERSRAPGDVSDTCTKGEAVYQEAVENGYTFRKK